MQEATTFNIFYDGTSFQHLATSLISVCTLCYGPGLLSRDSSCIIGSVMGIVVEKKCYRVLGLEIEVEFKNCGYY